MSSQHLTDGTPHWRVIEGDCFEVMRTLEAGSVDAIVTDPPYGLKFMGVAWDTLDGRDGEGQRRNTAERMDKQSGNHNPIDSADAARTRRVENQRMQPWHEAWAREALRVLRPNGCLLAFGGTRTYHRLVCGIEDAGFEVRDQLDWLYGSGFPKHPSALKPAHEPIVLARKSGARSEPLNIDACRIPSGEAWPGNDEPSTALNGYGPGDEDGWDGAWNKRSSSHDEGRWPANVIVDQEAATMLDKQTGDLSSPAPYVRGAAVDSAIYGDGLGRKPQGHLQDGYGDAGGASRFLYCPKPDSGERHLGGRNPHPTVKPIELMRWLIRLITPEGGLVLDPFTGSGTTGIAAMREGRSFVGIERDPEYVEVARTRIVADAPLLNMGAEAA
jgi:DNA modification methylase